MRRPRGDQGTVLLMMVGLAVVLLLMVAVVVDVSAVLLARRALSGAVDGAAVAAAQQPDIAVIRDGGLGERLPLDPAAVDDVVASYEQEAREGQPGLELLGHVERPETAVVDGRRTIRLPFAGWLGVGLVRVQAQGRARSPVLP